MLRILLTVANTMLRYASVAAGIEQVSNATRRLAVAALFVATAALSAGAAVIFLLIALWRFAEPRVGPELAPVVVAMVLLVISGLLIVTGRLLSRAPPTPPTQLPVLSLQTIEHRIGEFLHTAVAAFVAGLAKRP